MYPIILIKSSPSVVLEILRLKGCNESGEMVGLIPTVKEHRQDATAMVAVTRIPIYV
jgi:hypothetical protein